MKTIKKIYKKIVALFKKFFNFIRVMINNLKDSNRLNAINTIIRTNLSTFALHQKTFPQFKNKYLGKDIVILATGASAQKFKEIKNAVYIGVNRAFEIASKKDIKLDYVFIQDYSGKTKEYIDALDEYEPKTCTKFYGLTQEWLYEPERTIPEMHAIKANALRYRTDWLPFDGYKPQFAYDISAQALGCFGSIVFPALQFALWTHPKKIYLVGCDCTNSGYAYDTKCKNDLCVELVVKGMNQFKAFANKYYPDVEIISVNPVGLKGIFKDTQL